MTVILNVKQKAALCKLIGECEMCGSKDELTCHRIRRAYQDGLYTIRNIMILCTKCHKKVHFKEDGMRNK